MVARKPEKIQNNQAQKGKNATKEQRLQQRRNLLEERLHNANASTEKQRKDESYFTRVTSEYDDAMSLVQTR
jgi:hypothetical protein